MAVKAGVIVIDLVANTASFTDAMGKMSALSARTANEFKKSLETIGASVAAMIGVVGGATLELVKSSVDAAAHLDELSQSAGTTTEKLSAMGYAARLHGSSIDEMAKALERLSRSAFAAQNGNKALAAIFQRLGVQTSTDGKHLADSGDVMSQVSAKFAGMADGAGKTALAIQLFGKEGAQMIPFLNEWGAKQAEITAEAERFGIVISSDVARKANDFQTQMTKLHLVEQGFAQMLTAQLLPAIEVFGDKLQEIGKNVDLKALANSFGQEIVAGIKLAGDAIEFAANHAHELKIALEAIAAVKIAGVAVPLLDSAFKSGKIAEGVSNLATSALGVSKLAPYLEKMIGSLRYAIQFTKLLAVEEGITSAATYVLGGAFAFITSPLTLTVGALAGLGGALYALRDKQFTVRDSTYQLSDAYKALWQILTFTNKTGETSVTQIIKRIRAEREAAEAAAGKAAAPPSGGGGNKKPPPDTGGLGSQKDIYGDEVRKLQQSINAQKALFAVMGQGEEITRRVASEEAALAIITELNNRLMDERRPLLTAAQRAALQQLMVDKDSVTAKVKLGDSLVAETLAAKLSVDQATALTAAQFAGVDAVQAATIANELLAKTYGKPKDEADKLKKELDELGASLKKKYDAAAVEQLTQSLAQQTRSAQLAAAEADHLAAARLRGAEATRIAIIENELLAAQDGKTDAQRKAMRDSGALGNLEGSLKKKSEKEVVDKSNTDTSSLQVQIAQKKLLTDALLQSTDAQRAAAIAAQTYAINQQIAETSSIGIRAALLQQRDAMVSLMIEENRSTDIKAAGALLSPDQKYQKEIEDLNREAEALATSQGGWLTYAQNAQVAAKAQDIFNKSIDESVNLLLKNKDLQSGIDAFFLDMQKQAKAAAAIMYEAMNSAVNKISDQLATLITTGKADFGKMFEDIGKQMLSSSIKSALQTGLGAIGKHFGITGKADGSRANPFYVVLTSGAIGPTSGTVPGGIGGKLLGMLGIGQPAGTGHPDGSQANPFYTIQSQQGSQGGLGGLLGSFGGGAGGAGGDAGDGLTESVSSSIDYGGGFASGGDISPDKAYLVGEQGPEILAGVGGSITNNSTSRRMLQGGGGDTHNYTIDARGTDPVLTEQRVRQAIIASHHDAVTTSLRGNVEMQKRRPQQR